jgi:hypothetical protein
LIKNKVLFNKINIGVGITHMEEEFLPRKHGMEVIGYKDLISYVN